MIPPMPRSNPKVPKNPEIRQVRAQELSCDACPKTVVVNVSSNREHWPLHRCADGKPAPFTASAEIQQVALWTED